MDNEPWNICVTAMVKDMCARTLCNAEVEAIGGYAQEYMAILKSVVHAGAFRYPNCFGHWQETPVEATFDRTNRDCPPQMRKRLGALFYCSGP